jgi:uncharacterized protein (DUF2141 family)
MFLVSILTKKHDEKAQASPHVRVARAEMKLPVLLLVGAGLTATAHAQSEAPRVDFLPIPKTLPLVFFAPDSLAGEMLRPLDEPENGAELALATEKPAEEEPAAPEMTASVGTDTVAQADTEPQSEPAAEESASLDAEEAQEPAPEPAQPDTAIVHIIVENVESNSGTVNVAVCDTGLSEDGCPYHTSVPASQGFVEAVIDNVPPGAYAVVGYHDVNNNERFDKFLAMPREPYALSGKAAEVLVPDFEDAQLSINSGENFVIIRMKRLGSG